jgi:hypothetical protein
MRFGEVCEMSAYTDGPWRVRGPQIIPDRASFDWVASVQVSNCPNWEANARLIAAAPELLEALESMLIQFADACIIPEDDSACILARAAIAKATQI